MTEQMLQERVRAGLHALAGPPVGAAESRAAVERARAAAGGPRTGRPGSSGRRPGGGRATVWLVAAAVVALLAGAGAFRLLLPSPAGPAGATTVPITAWPARGNLTGDSTLIAQAEQVWRAEAPADKQPGRQVRVLYAGTVPDHHVGAGATVLMLLSPSGAHSLVGIVSSVQNLSGPARPPRQMVLRSVAALDTAVTDGAALRSVGFVAAATPADRPGEMSGSLGYVLLAPGIGTGEIQSSMVDSRMTDRPGLLSPAPEGLVSFQGFPGTGPWNSWVATPEGTPGVDVLAGAVGAPSRAPGTVDAGGAVTSDDGTPVHVGDLVVARDERPGGDGLLGVITEAGHGADTARGRIDPSLQDLGRFGVRAISYGSNYPGTLSRNAKGGLVFTTETPDAPNGVSRVVVQAADGSVTVNVGYFAGDPSAASAGNTTSPFPLRQIDTLPATGTRPVWIIATGA